jgi:hypothetical protein
MPDQSLETLAAAGLTVEVGGARLEITPIRVRELPAFARAIGPILADLEGGVDLAALLAAHPEAIIAATAIGARLPLEQVNDLALDELLALAFAVLEVNADFFARRIAPALTAGSERLATRLAGLSSTPASGAPA